MLIFSGPIKVNFIFIGQCIVTSAKAIRNYNAWYSYDLFYDKERTSENYSRVPTVNIQFVIQHENVSLGCELVRKISLNTH